MSAQAPEFALSEYQRKIIAVLDTRGGETTSLVARRVEPVFCGNRRMHAAAIRSWLVQLEGAGLVRRMDDQKPVCWMLTEKAAT